MAKWRAWGTSLPHAHDAIPKLERFDRKGLVQKEAPYTLLHGLLAPLVKLCFPDHVEHGGQSGT